MSPSCPVSHSSLMIDSEKLKTLGQPEIRGIIEDLETLGLYNPLNKVFSDLPHSPYFALFWVIFVISIVPKMYLFGNCHINKVLKRINNRMDGLPVVYGLVTIFRQYNSSLTNSFLDYMDYYIRSCVESLINSKQEMTYDLAVAIRFLDVFQRLSKQPVLRRTPLPDVIFNNYENWLNNS